MGIFMSKFSGIVHNYIAWMPKWNCKVSMFYKYIFLQKIFHTHISNLFTHVLNVIFVTHIRGVGSSTGSLTLRGKPYCVCFSKISALNIRTLHFNFMLSYMLRNWTLSNPRNAWKSIFEKNLHDWQTLTIDCKWIY